jgi:CMP-N-acetylneuraminic acid synthetase
VTVFAFVFARGGSKGLPGKNVRLLAGKPLIAHSIAAARAVGAIDRVFVSTESDEIASVARHYGAEVIARPAELATDTAPEWLAWQHAVRTLREQGAAFDYFVSLPATSPLRTPADIEGCLTMLDETADVAIVVTPSARNPYFNMVVRQPDGATQVVLNAGTVTRRQDAPAVYDITTVAYVTRPDFVVSNSGIFAGRVASFVIPKERAVDIDDEVDFCLAEVLIGRREHDDA